MKLQKCVIGMACALLAVVIIERVCAQEDAEKPDGEKMMEAWAAANAPGEFHAVLGGTVGNWTFKSKFRPAAEAPWIESTGKSEIRWAMGTPPSAVNSSPLLSNSNPWAFSEIVIPLPSLSIEMCFSSR